jgi:amidase
MWEAMVVEHALTRSVRDSAAMLDVLAYTETQKSFAVSKMHGSFLGCLEKPLKKLQIGLTDHPFFPATVEPEYVASLNKAGKLCQDLGHSVEMVSLKINSTEVARAYIIVTAGEIAASIKRFSASIGKKPAHKDLERQTALLCHMGEHLSAADFAWARNILDVASRQMAQYFNDYDMLVTPTMPCPPPLIGELKPDFFEQSMQEILTHVPFAPVLHKALEHAAGRNFAFYPFTPIFNISGQPAMSVPLYWDANGLPIGIQFAGRFGEEASLLQLAHQLEQACPWQAKKPLQNTV